MPRISEKKAAAKSRVPRLPSEKERWAKSAGSTIGRGWRRLRATTRAEQQRGGGEGGERPGAGPAPVVALDDPQRHRRQAERQHQRPGQVGQAAVASAWLGQQPAAGEQQRGAERQVDEEDEPPAVEFDQGGAEGRPGRRGRGGGGAPEADPGRPLLGREAVEDDRQRGRRDRRRPRPLQDAEGDQRLERGRDRAEQAGEGEEAEAAEEDALVAEAVGEPAGRDQQRRDDDEVAVEHPGEQAPARLREGGRDVREGDVDDRRVEEDEEGAGAGDEDARSMPAVIHRGGDYTMTVGITRLADAKAIEPTRRDGRDRLLNGARRLLAEKGYAGMELRDVAERGKAPRGSIYHHFPGGKQPAGDRGGRTRGARDPRRDRKLARRARPRRDAQHLRRDVPPPGQGPAGAARLPGRRRRPGPARGPGARRRRHRGLRKLGSADRRRPARGRRRQRPTPRPSPASSSRRSRARWSAPAPPATRRRSTPPSPACTGRSKRCSADV